MEMAGKEKIDHEVHIIGRSLEHLLLQEDPYRTLEPKISELARAEKEGDGEKAEAARSFIDWYLNKKSLLDLILSLGYKHDEEIQDAIYRTAEFMHCLQQTNIPLDDRDKSDDPSATIRLEFKKEFSAFRYSPEIDENELKANEILEGMQDKINEISRGKKYLPWMNLMVVLALDSCKLIRPVVKSRIEEWIKEYSS